jgi:hypothetical protein
MMISADFLILYDNLCKLGVVNKSEGFGADVDVERVNSFFLSRQSVGVNIDLVEPFSSNVPEFSVTQSEVCNAVMSIKSNATEV